MMLGMVRRRLCGFYRPSVGPAVNPRRGSGESLSSSSIRANRSEEIHGRMPMLFHHCPDCAPAALSRRGFMAGLGAAGLAAAAPAPAVRAQGAKTLIDTHCHFWAPSYLAQQLE